MNKRVYMTVDVEAGATSFACDFLRNFKLEKIKEVSITPAEYGGIVVSFFYETYPNMFMKIDMKDAFCVGYRGEGPWGLHDIMIEAGFPEYTASRVFEISRYAENTFVK